MKENLNNENEESKINDLEGIEEKDKEEMIKRDLKNDTDTENYDNLKSDYDEVQDRILRLTAEFDNYKKRAQNDITRASESGKIEVIKNILPVIDEFELALLSVENSKKNPELNTVIKGVEMIYANLKDTLKRVGLEVIRADGEFDPNLHEILMTKESDKKEGSILEVIKKGYTLNGLIIRPVMVIVSGKVRNDKTENTDNDINN